MTSDLVTLVNPNLVHPPITPYALDILGTSLEAAGFEVEVLDLCLGRDDWQGRVENYFSRRSPLLVGVTIRNTDTIYPQEQRVFLGSHRDIITAIARRTQAPIVGGGVGFSSMPFALVDYFDLDFGVKGPGEVTVVRLAEALAAAGDGGLVPGVIVNDHAGHIRENGYGSERLDRGRARLVNLVTPYKRHSGRQDKVDNLAYYQRGGLGNILTKNGCTYACTHCVEPDAKGTRFALRPPTAVVDEMESLLEQGVRDLHTTDSEFNLNIAHSKRVLREIIRRKRMDARSPLGDLRLWVYVQPAPFDDEYASLLAEAGCAGINVAPDHMRPELLDGWKVTGKGHRFYDVGDVAKVCAWARQYDIPTMVEVLLGMPGETESTLRDCVRSTLALNATVVGYTLGIRAFPYSPLGQQLAELSDGTAAVPGVQSNTATGPILLTPRRRCADPVAYERQFMFDPDGQFRPVYYFSPALPDGAGATAPGDRWHSSLELLWNCVPPDDRDRVMLPTTPGLSPEDNNYADNPFLLRLTELGYTGAYWSHWPNRHKIMRQQTPANA